MSERKISLRVTSLTAVLLALSGAASATNHFVQINEVMSGAFGRMNVQFVEMTVGFCGQGMWGPGATMPRARLVFFDENDNQTGQFLFPNNAPDPCTGTFSVLIGTQAFADLASTPNPDFIMPAGIMPASGKVCFKGTTDAFAFHPINCLSYGSFSGDTEERTGVNAPEIPGTNICALQRFRHFDPNIDFGDENIEKNDNNDFLRLAPAPRNAAGSTGTVVIPSHFTDVSTGNTFFRFIEAIRNFGITNGCGGTNYCPLSNVTRQEMAAFLVRGVHGGTFQPPACTTPQFNDVPCSNTFSKWINKLKADGITNGCGGGNYCPFNNVTRQEMAAFLVRAKHGGSFQPPACTTPQFNDVPCSNTFSKWINQLKADGVTNGCGGGNYCPFNLVSRQEMAAFLARNFGLPIPSTATCCAHDKCSAGPTAGVPLNAACDSCVAAICAADPFCCATDWDSQCVGQVSSICGLSC